MAKIITNKTNNKVIFIFPDSVELQRCYITKLK